jgi:DNA polymerase-3 subunit beta
MKLIVKKQAFENALVSLQSFLERKDFSHITSHIYFEATPDALILKATDNEIGLQVKITDFILEEAGTSTCNGKKLLDIIRIVKQDDIIFNATSNMLHIKQGRSNYKLPTFEASQFPAFPSANNLPKVEINSLKLISAFKKAMPSVDSNNPKHELNGALIDIKDNQISIVSTDTKRLALIKLPHELTQTLSLIIPKKAISEIQKLFFNELEIYFDQTNFIIQNANYFFYTKVINGKFPDFARIIPKEIQNNLTLSKEILISAIKQVNIFSNEIKMSFNPNGILFESMSNENFEAKTELEISTGFDREFTIAVNSRYIIDFLSGIETKEFVMSFNEPNTPFQLSSDNFITIIMPIAL